MTNNKTAYERLKESNAWAVEYNLPLSPQNLNPHVYLALATKLIKRHDGVLSLEIIDAIYDYLHLCEIEPGLYNRYPNGRGGVTSHDELIGIAYQSPTSAKYIYQWLITHDGIYNNTKLSEPIPMSWDLFKFPWFVSYLKARAGYRLSFMSELWYSLHVLKHTIFATKDSDEAGPNLLIWLMNEEMQKYPMCKRFIEAWRWRLNKLGLSPKYFLAKEPRENPIYAEIGPTSF